MPQAATGCHRLPQVAPTPWPRNLKNHENRQNLSIFHQKSMTNALTATQTHKLSCQGVPDVIIVLKRDRSLFQTYETHTCFQLLFNISSECHPGPLQMNFSYSKHVKMKPIGTKKTHWDIQRAFKTAQIRAKWCKGHPKRARNRPQ